MEFLVKFQTKIQHGRGKFQHFKYLPLRCNIRNNVHILPDCYLKMEQKEAAEDEKIDLKLGIFGSSPATEPSLELIDKIMLDVGTSSFERLSKQEPSCWFGEWGVCCRLCYMGPCRIQSVRFKNGASRGVCGATADTIVARNLLRETVGGASSHAEHAFEIAETLKLVANGKIKGYEIKDRKKLLSVAKNLQIETNGKTDGEIANEIADISIGDFNKVDDTPMKWVKAYAPSSSYKHWNDLDIIPTNAWTPIMNAMHRTSMGNDADVTNLLLADLKMGIIDGYSGLTMSTELSDILFGTPKPVSTTANVGVLKEEYVNLAIHGHNPLVAEKVLEWAVDLNEDAKKLGARGINVVGVCCSGNEVLMRHGVPMAANEMQAELAIATGALDAMVADFQCIWPILGEVASCYNTKLITTMPYVKIPGALHIEFSVERADEVAKQIVEEALIAFQKRDPSRVLLSKKIEPMIGGFSVESIAELLGKINKEDPLKPLIDSIVSGDVYGVVGIVGCPNPKLRKELYTERLINVLLKNNILVLVTGCIAHISAQEGFMNPARVDEFDIGEGLKGTLKALGKLAGLESLPPAIHMGSCVDNSRIGVLVKLLSERLNVDVSALPVIASAPELIAEKAVAIGTWALSMGLPVHTAPELHIEGGKQVKEILSESLKSLTGAETFAELNPEKAAQKMIDMIRQKRVALGLSA